MIIDPRQLPQLGAPSKAPGFAATTYGNDSALTRTGGGPGGYSYADALNKIIMGRLAKPKVAAPTAAPAKGTTIGGSGAKSRVLKEYDPLEGLRQQAQRQALIAQMQEQADKDSPVPLHYTRRGFNAPALTADLAGMSMAQRQAYEALGTKGTYGRNDEVEA